MVVSDVVAAVTGLVVGDVEVGVAVDLSDDVVVDADSVVVGRSVVWTAIVEVVG